MLGRLKFGADPEFFAAYQDSEGLHVLPPVILRTDKGAKFEENGRHPIFAHYGKTIVHEDGAAFEMSTPPSNSWQEIWSAIDEAKTRFGSEFLSQYPDTCLPMLMSLPAMNFQVERWLGRGPEFEMSTLFGCDPDQDVFNMKAKCQVVDASQHPWRYAGGHIHVSGMKEIEDAPLQAIKSMVLTAGLACTAFTDVPELEKERLFLYGKPGKFRIQSYPNGETGVEYRTPSTRWTDDKTLAEQVFSWAEIGMVSLLKGGLLAEIEKAIMAKAKKAIIEVNQPMAKELLAFIGSKV
jgi:hypothetical protein